MQPSAADLANQHMVDALIAEGALWSPELIASFRATPRHHFLHRVYQYQSKQQRWREILTQDPGPDEIQLLYSDQALITRLGLSDHERGEVPISSSSQPSLMAQMLEDLRLAPGMRVLEIGAGTGYNAALMAHVVGAGNVATIDVDRMVLAEAWEHLQTFADRRIAIHHADGRSGFPGQAPYDRIMVTASTPDLQPAWLAQVAENGLISAPLNLAPGVAYVVRGVVNQGVFQGRLMRGAYFMPLRDEGESGESEPADSFETSQRLRTMPAPWAGWFDRKRPRLHWLRFMQALAFYSWLRGLTVHYRRSSEGQPGFGISRDEGSDCCWLGPQDWHVNGNEGRDLGWTLWRTFLAAGGPWPTEFRLWASPRHDLQPAGQREEYLRNGPCCQHLWHLIEPRDRPAWL